MRFSPDDREQAERPGRDNARALRGAASMPERKLWNLLRAGRFRVDGVPVKFRRQHPIGPYTADFFCTELGLVIELDGGAHSVLRDRTRDDAMISLGLHVSRSPVPHFERHTDATMRDIAHTVRELRAKNSER